VDLLTLRARADHLLRALGSRAMNVISITPGGGPVLPSATASTRLGVALAQWLFVIAAAGARRLPPALPAMR
jgi:hypothetical protein